MMAVVSRSESTKRRVFRLWRSYLLCCMQAENSAEEDIRYPEDCMAWEHRL